MFSDARASAVAGLLLITVLVGHLARSLRLHSAPPSASLPRAFSALDADQVFNPSLQGGGAVPGNTHEKIASVLFGVVRARSVPQHHLRLPQPEAVRAFSRILRLRGGVDDEVNDAKDKDASVQGDS
jgi:hypothetical protein